MGEKFFRVFEDFLVGVLIPVGIKYGHINRDLLQWFYYIATLCPLTGGVNVKLFSTRKLEDITAINRENIRCGVKTLTEAGVLINIHLFIEHTRNNLDTVRGIVNDEADILFKKASIDRPTGRGYKIISNDEVRKSIDELHEQKKGVIIDTQAGNPDTQAVDYKPIDTQAVNSDTQAVNADTQAVDYGVIDTQAVELAADSYIKMEYLIPSNWQYFPGFRRNRVWEDLTPDRSARIIKNVEKIRTNNLTGNKLGTITLKEAEEFFEELLMVGRRGDYFTNGGVRTETVESILTSAVPIIGTPRYLDCVTEINPSDARALPDVITYLLNSMLEDNDDERIEALKDVGKLPKDAKAVWSIPTYLRWVKRFGANSKYVKAPNILDYFNEQAIDFFRRYMRLKRSPFRAYQHELELVEVYYETFPEDYKYKVRGYEKVVEMVQDWLTSGFPWYYLPPILKRGVERSGSGKPLAVWDFKPGNVRSKLGIDIESVPVYIEEEGEKWAGVDTDARETPEPFKTELWLLSEYRKWGREVFEDKKWLEKDEAYGYAKYFREVE